MSSQAVAIKVVIADDHRLFRESLKILLQNEPEINVVGEASNGEEAVALSQALSPDVVLMDIEMPIVDGIEAARLITQKTPLTKVLILSNFEEDERVYQAMLAGARGYVVKRIGTTSLVGILKAVQNNELLVTPYLANMILHDDRASQGRSKAKPFNLTEQEVRILELLVKGYSNKEISNTIYISLDTVKAHLKHIFNKLDVDCRTKAAIKALKCNIVPNAGQ